MVNLSYFSLATLTLLGSTTTEAKPWNFSQDSQQARGTGSMWQFRPRSDFYFNSYLANRVPAAQFPERQQWWKTRDPTLGGAWNPFRPKTIWNRPSYANNRPVYRPRPVGQDSVGSPVTASSQPEN